jgi:uncharacterized membrane protein
MRRFRDLLVDGLLLALPLGGAAYLLHRAFTLLLKLLDPVAHLLPQGRWFGIAAVEVAALALLVLALLLLGLVARSALGVRIGGALENAVMSKIPGYLIIKSIVTDFASGEHSAEFRPALVSFNDNAALGFIVEESVDGGRFTVFVPSAPGAASGSVVLVAAERVQALDVPVAHARRSLKLRGLGLQQLVSARSHTASEDRARLADEGPSRSMTACKSPANAPGRKAIPGCLAHGSAKVLEAAKV